MTLLLVGASGFLGPHLVRAARRRGLRVAAASRRPAAGPRAPGTVPDELHELDAAVPDAAQRLAALLEAVQPSALLLAAACARVEECERDPERAAALNVALPAAAARLARARGLRLVHLSTDLVFGARPPRGARYAEDDPPSPVHAYGRSKAAGEAAVLAADPPALVLRLPLLYGDSFGRGLGASDHVLAALARGEQPALFTDEWRTPLEAGNAAEAVLELLAGDARGLLHLAGPARLNRHELALAVLAARGRAGEAGRLGAVTRAARGLAAQRPADVSLDAGRALTLLSMPLLGPTEALRAARERSW
ncbi:MAG TPA: sugar nucleotide-binding protein [Planctomycetota bacterium]